MMYHTNCKKTKQKKPPIHISRDLSEQWSNFWSKISKTDELQKIFKHSSSQTVLSAAGERRRDLLFCELLLAWMLQRSGPEKRARGGSADQSAIQKRGIIPGDRHSREHAPPPSLFFSWVGLTKRYCVHSHRQVSCGGEGRLGTHREERVKGNEMICSFTRNNEEMSHDHTTSTHFRFECLLVVGCRHTSACLLSLSLTCDIKKTHILSLETHINEKHQISTAHMSGLQLCQADR